MVHLRAWLIILVMALTLTGCFRQADDNFETLNTEDTLEAITAEPTEDAEAQEADADEEPTAIVIDPNETPADAMTDEDAPDEALIEETTNTPRPTSTMRPSQTPIPPPAEDDAADTLATATDIVIITPDAPGGSQLTFQTPVPSATPRPTQASADDEETSNSDEDSPITDDDCIYVVNSGDNLFRIALNNDVTLADLLAENGLTENAIIQPGQELTLPDCEPTIGAATSTSDDDEAAADDDDSTGSDETVIHVVESGETLGAIAAQYGVSVLDIVAANELPNANNLALGQELIIPLDN